MAGNFTGIMMDGPTIEGVWQNPKTGDFFTVRDSYMEDDDFIIIATDGRRFNYKIEFVKPNHEQRVELWKKLIPAALPLENGFDFEKIAKHELTGGQIELVIKNTAYKLAVLEDAVFTLKDFEEQISKEKKGQFDSETKVGFF